MFVLAACAADSVAGGAGGGIGEKLRSDVPGNVNGVNAVNDMASVDASAYSRYIGLGKSFSAEVGAASADQLCGRSPLA
jgi:hypothetical protein